MFIHFYRKSHRKSQDGFTLVELMVTLGIIVLVTGVVMVRYASFNSSVLLNSQAYITAFDVREAQSLAVSVRGFSNQFREEYGLHFAMSDPFSYTLFLDDASYGDTKPAQFNPDEAIGSPYSLDPRFAIVDLCGTTTDGTTTCYSDDADFDYITISFKRPDFDAAFHGDLTNLSSVEIIFGSSKDIGVQNPSDITRSVVVYQSGQIAVE